MEPSTSAPCNNLPMRNNLITPTLTTLVFNTAIAGLLTVVGFEENFWINLVFSQCIGFSIYLFNATLLCRISSTKWRLPVLALSFPFSILFGVSLASWLTGMGSWDDPRIRVTALIGLFFGGIGAITYFLGERIWKLDAEVKQRRMNEIETEKRQIEAHLKLLQAQIEPHFLFNTLANVASLIDTDAIAARRLLERLDDWLRVALARARSEHCTLGDEVTLLENYLEILSTRFGQKLRWKTDVDHQARQAAFAPMLLQPLVENAVTHGIGPKLGGGTLHIMARVQENLLRITVQDDGVGLDEQQQPGTGLANVRARLAALYGDLGKLTLQSNIDGGVTACLELPL